MIPSITIQAHLSVGDLKSPMRPSFLGQDRQVQPLEFRLRRMRSARDNNRRADRENITECAHILHESIRPRRTADSTVIRCSARESDHPQDGRCATYSLCCGHTLIHSRSVSVLCPDSSDREGTSKSVSRRYDYVPMSSLGSWPRN